MGTTMSPELSERNKYHISKHRMYELKHYCLQYHHWVDALADIDFMKTNGITIPSFKRNGNNNPTADIAELRELMLRNINLVERSAKETDPVIGPYILRAVTEGWGYERLAANEQVPCSSVTYYKYYRKFFWILDKKRS